MVMHRQNCVRQQLAAMRAEQSERYLKSYLLRYFPGQDEQRMATSTAYLSDALAIQAYADKVEAEYRYSLNPYSANDSYIH